MEFSPLSLALWSVIDVRDRLLRFSGALQELERRAEPGERAFLGNAEGQVANLVVEYQDQIAATFTAIIGRDGTDPDNWRGSVEAIAALARTEFDTFAPLQYELFPFLPIGQRPTSDAGFFLARCLGLSPTRESERRLFALVFGRYSTWTSRAFESPVGSVAVVPLPYVESLTPLRWPLLVHELAHFVLPGGKPITENLVQQRLKEFSGSDFRKAEPSFREILADRVAFNACGLSYPIALLTEALLDPNAGHASSPDTPNVVERVGLLGPSALQLAKSVPTSWGIARKSGVTKKMQERLQVLAEPLARHDAYQQPDSKSVEGGLGLVGRDRCFCSVQRFQTFTLDELDRVRRKAGGKKAEVNAFLSPIETPLSDAEILEVAWRNLVDKPSTDILRRAQIDPSNGKPIKSTFLDDVHQVIDYDTSISRSLQAATVHRWLTTWDRSIGKAIASGVTVQDDQDSGSSPGTTDQTPRIEWNEDSPLTDIQLVQRLTTGESSKRLVLRPLIDPRQIGGTTVDLRLGTEWEVLRTSRFKALNPGDPIQRVTDLLEASVEEFRLTTGQYQDLVLHPGELLLALTLEYLKLPDDLWGNLEGRSTWARIGLQVHATAGMVDAGFEGYLTFELQNTGRLPLVLFPGLRVGQMAFFPVANVVRPYHSKPAASYSAQTSARSARII